MDIPLLINKILEEVENVRYIVTFCSLETLKDKMTWYSEELFNQKPKVTERVLRNNACRMHCILY